MQKSVLCIFQKYLNILTLEYEKSKKLCLKFTYTMQRCIDFLDLHARAGAHPERLQDFVFK